MWFRSNTKIHIVPALWREFCAVVWARKILGLILFSGMLGGGLLFLGWRAPLYESSLKILVTPATPQSSFNKPAFNSAESVTPTVGNTTLQEARNTEIEILTSHEILTAVATELKLPALVTAEQIAARLSVTAHENSPVITVTYRDTAPAQATQILHTLWQKYANYRVQLRPPSSVDEELRARSLAFQQKLTTTTSALQQLDAAQNIPVVAAQKDLLLQQFYDLQKQADATRTEKATTEQQLVTLRQQLAAQPEQIETSAVTKFGAALDKIKEEVSSLEMQRTQLLQKYQPHHRLVLDLEQRIAQAKELRAREEQNPAREHTVARNETYRRLQNDLLNAEANLAGLSQREIQLRNLSQEYETRLRALKVQEHQKNELERARSLQEEAFLLFQKKAQEADLKAVLQATNETHVNVLENVRISPHPINVHWARDVFGLLCLSLSVALGGVIARESWQPRIRHAEGIQRRLGLPVIAALPLSRNVHFEN